MHSLRIPVRTIVYTQDIMNITGKSRRSAQRTLKSIREEYQKSKKQCVTIDELCGHLGIKQEQIIHFFG
jgi:hypothetical protein